MTSIVTNVFLKEAKNKLGAAAAGWQISRVELFQVGVKYILFSSSVSSSLNTMAKWKFRVNSQKRRWRWCCGDQGIRGSALCGVCVCFPCLCAGVVRVPITVKLMNSRINIHLTLLNKCTDDGPHLPFMPTHCALRGSGRGLRMQRASATIISGANS